MSAKTPRQALAQQLAATAPVGAKGGGSERRILFLWAECHCLLKVLIFPWWFTGNGSFTGLFFWTYVFLRELKKMEGESKNYLTSVFASAGDVISPMMYTVDACGIHVAPALKIWETIVRWYLQENHKSRDSWWWALLRTTTIVAVLGSLGSRFLVVRPLFLGTWQNVPSSNHIFQVPSHCGFVSGRKETFGCGSEFNFLALEWDPWPHCFQGMCA